MTQTLAGMRAGKVRIVRAVQAAGHAEIMKPRNAGIIKSFGEEAAYMFMRKDDLCGKCKKVQHGDSKVGKKLNMINSDAAAYMVYTGVMGALRDAGRGNCKCVDKLERARAQL